MRLLITGIIVFLILFYFYLIWPRLSRKRQIRPFLHTMFAHRGYHCIEKGIPENSIPSFRAAISHGYGIELDVHLTSDGKLAYSMMTTCLVSVDDRKPLNHSL